jgi:hypothetical protein
MMIIVILAGLNVARDRITRRHHLVVVKAEEDR